MELNKNKLLLICGAIIVLLVIFILLFQTTTISQNFSFSNFEMTKTILINGENRVETYTFDTENPLIAYLIVPKTIANDISQLTISGDYSTTIIENDPILLIKQNEYTPGIKKLTIETITGNKEHTTILLPINLTDYENFTEIEKQELTQTIKQFQQMDENYYTTEEVKKIIEEFAKGIENQIELKEKKNFGKISFASNENISPTLDTLIDSITGARKEKENQLAKEVEQKKTDYQGYFITINDLIKPRLKNTIIYQDPNQYNVTIVFKPKEDILEIPNEIVLSYNPTNPKIIWNAIVTLSEEQEIEEGVELIFEGPENINFEYVRLTKENYQTLGTKNEKMIQLIEQNDSQKPIYLISLIIDGEKYSQIQETEIVSIQHKIFMPNKQELKITFIKNPCENKINNYWNSEDYYFNYELQSILTETGICIKDKIEEELTKKILDYNVELKDANRIDNSIIIASINNDPESTKKLQEEIKKTNEEIYKNYLDAQKEHTIWMNEYISIAQKGIYELKDINSKLEDKSTQEIMTKNILWFEYLISEQKVKNDPTKPKLLEDSIAKYTNQLLFPEDITEKSVLGIEMFTTQEAEFRENQINKFGDYNAKYHLTEIISKIIEIDTKIEESKKALAKLLIKGSIISSKTNASINNCPTNDYIEDMLYADEHNTALAKDFKTIIDYLAFNKANYMSQGSQPVLGGERELTEIEKTVKRFNEYYGCELDLDYFENPSANKAKLIIAEIPLIGTAYGELTGNSVKQIDAFNETREGLRESITQNVKERQGLRIIALSLYGYKNDIENLTKLQKERNRTNYFENPKMNFNTFYEQIKPTNGGLTLLELYELDSPEKLSKIFNESTNETTKQEAFECIREAFNNSLKSKMSELSYLKFKPFIGNYQDAEKLESDLAFIEGIISAELEITAKKVIEKQDSEKKNYIIYNLLSGALIEDFEDEIKERIELVNGFKKIRTKLLNGEDYVEILEETKEKLKEKGFSQLQPPAKLVSPYQIEGDDFIATGDNIRANPNKYIEWQKKATAYVEWRKKLLSLGEEHKIYFALVHPIMIEEIKKQLIIEENYNKNEEKIKVAKTEEEKMELIYPKEMQAKTISAIADYYYDNDLYFQAFQNYTFIDQQLDKTSSATHAKTRIRQMSGVTMFFGKMYWQTFGKVTREFVSLQSIATYALFYLPIKFFSIPKIASARNLKGLKEGLSAAETSIMNSKTALATQAQIHEMASINAMKNGIKGFEIINGRLVQLDTTAMVTKSQWLIKNQRFLDKVWRELTKDRLMSEKWYQGYVERVVARDAKEFLRTTYMPGLSNDPKLQLLEFYKKTGQLNETIAAANTLRKTGALTQREMLWLDDELRFLTARPVEVVSSTGSPFSSSTTRFMQRQLTPVSEVSRAKTILSNPTPQAGNTIDDILGSPVDDTINFGKPTQKSIQDLLQQEAKLAKLNERITTLEGYINLWKDKGSMSLINQWQSELSQLRSQVSLIDDAINIKGPLNIACSFPCGIKIKINEQTYGLGEINSAQTQLVKASTVSVNPNNPLNFGTITIGETPAKLNITQILDTSLKTAIITPALSTTPGVINLTITTPRFITTQGENIIGENILTSQPNITNSKRSTSNISVSETEQIIANFKDQIVTEFNKPALERDYAALAEKIGAKYLGSGGNGAAFSFPTKNDTVVVKIFKGYETQAEFEAESMKLVKGEPLFQQYLTHGSYTGTDITYLASGLVKGTQGVSLDTTKWESMSTTEKQAHQEKLKRTIENIPDEHWDQLALIYKQAEEKGILIDPNPENLFYDPLEGFTAIDFHSKTALTKFYSGTSASTKLSSLPDEAPIIVAGKNFSQREGVIDLIKTKVNSAIERILNKNITPEQAKNIILYRGSNDTDPFAPTKITKISRDGENIYGWYFSHTPNYASTYSSTSEIYPVKLIPETKLKKVTFEEGITIKEPLYQQLLKEGYDGVVFDGMAGLEVVVINSKVVIPAQGSEFSKISYVYNSKTKTFGLTTQKPKITLGECVAGCSVQTNLTGPIVQSTESGVLAKATASRTEVDFERVVSISVGLKNSTSVIVPKYMQEFLPENLKKYTDPAYKIYFVNSEEFTRIRGGNDSACTLKGCQLRTGEVIIHLEQEEFFDGVTVYNEAAVEATIWHELWHRGFWNMNEFERAAIVSKFKSNTIFAELRQEFSAIWPGYEKISDEAMVSEMISRTIQYQLYPTKYDEFVPEAAEFIKRNLQPLIDNETRQLLQRGLENYSIQSSETFQATKTTGDPINYPASNLIKKIKMFFSCNSPCILPNMYSHQVVKDSTLVEINYESMKGVSEVKPPETRVLPIDKEGMRSSINPNGLYKKVGDEVIPYSPSDIEALIEKAQNLKNKEGLVVSYYFNGVVQPVIYKLPVAKIIPADLPPMDYTLVSGFEETTKKTGVKIVKGIPTRAGQGYEHSLFHIDEYGGLENFNLWIKKTLETPSYTYYRENETKKIYVKPMDSEAKKMSVIVTEITNGEEIYMTMYTVQIPDEYIKMLRNELAKGDHKTFKSKTDPDERVLIVGDKISIIVKRTNNGGKGINIQAKNSIIPLDNYEPVGANNVNRLFNDLDPTKIEINLSEIIN